MKTITHAFSHINYGNKRNNRDDKDWLIQSGNSEIISSDPYYVDTYDRLVNIISQILYYNPGYSLFYRGQNKDYKNTEGNTTILPSIYRKRDDESRLFLKPRFEKLAEKSSQLIELLSVREKKLAGTINIKKFPEVAWSILQHYEVCDTPLLDITQSLHVACSFAFDKNIGETGIVYVIGLPWIHDSISYHTHEEIVNVKLLGICPPQAHRPFFQEGYLTGTFPSYKIDSVRKVPQFDFNRRLIAKFEMPKKAEFWGDGFSAIPHSKLYQDSDLFKTECEKIK